MNNLDWLCENDREQLMKLLAEGDSCEYCALEIEDDCGVRCNEGVRAWLEAEHSDVLKPENGAGAEEADANDANPKADACGRISAEDFAQAMSDGMEKLNAAIESHGKTHGFYAFDEMDTREKLEADIHEFKRRHAQDKLELIAFESIACRWLDRQKKITVRECDWCESKGFKLYERICQLEAELDEREAECRNAKHEENRLCERIRQLEQVVQADKEDCAQSFADMKVMENQRDRARAERDKYRGQRDLYRKKLGDAVWHAQAIARMTEVDA